MLSGLVVSTVLVSGQLLFKGVSRGQYRCTLSERQVATACQDSGLEEKTGQEKAMHMCGTVNHSSQLWLVKHAER